MSPFLRQSLTITAAVAALCVAPVAAFAQTATATTPAAEAPAAKPKLIVVLVIDQFSANLFNQYRSRFTGGLARLAREGVVYANGFQQHGGTETCAGHAAIATGMNPTAIGIPANDWIDSTTGQEVYCLNDQANTLADGGPGENGRVGTSQLRATAFADWLKAASPQSRIFAVSGKDRGAINLAGRAGEAFWLTGTFGLTTYLRPGDTAEARLAPVAAFNQVYQAASGHGKAPGDGADGGAGGGGAAAASDATAEIPPLWTGAFPQCQKLASDWTINGQTFRSAVPPDNPVFDRSPLLDETTIYAALTLLEGQQLGRGEAVDMLGVSLSGTDRVGHRYGTQGPEMCEQLFRLDAALTSLLDALPPGTLLVMSADHGGSDFVERSAARGMPGARRASVERLTETNKALQARFKLPAPPLFIGGSGVMVGGADHKPLAPALQRQVVAAAVEMLKTNPDLAFVEVRETLLADPLPPADVAPELLTVRQRMRLSVVGDRSPDIVIAMTEGVAFGGRVGRTIAEHGNPWDHDRRVPILFWTADGQPQERFWSARTIDIAPTLAAAAGVPAPKVDGRCLTLNMPLAGACGE